MTKIEVKDLYKEYLNSRIGVTNYDRFKKILYGAPDSLVIRLARSLIPKIRGDDISMLDVGGGNGERAKFLMLLMETRGIKSTCELVEPSDAFVNDLKESLEDHDLDYKINIQHCLFEDYSTIKKFDLIILIHSIYTFKDDQYIKKIKTLLKPGGLAVFVTNKEGSFLGRLKAIADASLGTKRNEARSVLEDLQRSGFDVDQEESATYFSDCLDDGNLNDDGKLSLAWIALRDYENLPEEVIRSATSLFVESSKEGRIEDMEIFLFAKVI